MNALVRSILVLLASLLFLSACATPPPVTASAVPASAPSGSPEYKLGAGDKLRLIVYDQPNLSGEFALDGQGDVSLPLVGKVSALNLTTRQFEEAIVAKLKDGYLTDPRVSAQVMNFRPYYILGEVNKAGEYPFMDGMTVFKAVATAQGFTYRADQKRVYIKGAHDPVEKLYRLDSATPIAPGDTVRIPERVF